MHFEVENLLGIYEAPQVDVLKLIKYTTEGVF